MATSSLEGEIVKCGYLTKSPSSGGRGRFKRRWFVLSSSGQDCHPASGNGASALSCSTRLDYYEKENSVRKGSINLAARCLMLEDPDHHAPYGKKRRQSTPCFNLILMKDSSKLKSGREAFASRFQLQAVSAEEKQSWLQAFQQCGVSILKTEKEVDPVQTKPTFYLADPDSTNDLILTVPSPSSAIPVPQALCSPTDLAATVPGGMTFASCAGEDVPLSELFSSEREISTTSAHALRTDIGHAHSCAELCSYRLSDQVSSSSHCRGSRHLFRASAGNSLTYSPLDSRSKPLANNLHELSRQLESIPYIVQFNQDQIFLSCDTLSAGHFEAVHTATLLSLSSEPTLQTVSVRVVGSHCSEREAVRLLQQAGIMAQLSHDNIATVLGMVLSQQPKLIIMEYLSKGDLQNHLLSLQLNEKGVRETLPTTLLSYCQQIATGMAFLVDRGCVVSTLAAKYILLSERDVCKITGVECPSYRLCHEQAISSAICQDRDVLRFERDVWSFGTVLYEIWSVGRTPFEGSESCKKRESLSSVLLPPPPGCPRTVYKLMMQCWNAVSVDKPTWITINKFLQDPDLVLQTEAQEDDDFVPRDGFLLGNPLESSVNLYKDLQLEYGPSVLLHPHYKIPANEDTTQGKDWTIFSPAPQDRVSFSPSELEQDLEHSTKLGVRESLADQ